MAETTTTDRAPLQYAALPPISRPARLLIDAHGAAAQAWGAWRSESGESFRPLYDACGDTRDALVSYVATLEADLARLRATERGR